MSNSFVKESIKLMLAVVILFSIGIQSGKSLDFYWIKMFSKQSINTEFYANSKINAYPFLRELIEHNSRSGFNTNISLELSGKYGYAREFSNKNLGLLGWSVRLDRSNTAMLPPTNDLCSAAEGLTSGLTVPGTTVDATSIGGEIAPGSVSTPFGSVWYSFTLTAPNQQLVIDVLPTNNPLPIMSQGIGLYSSCGTKIGDGGGPFCLVPGTIYYIQVASANSDEGSFDITVTQSASPAVAVIAETDMSGNADDGQVCIGGSATLEASGGSSYVWDDMTTNPIKIVTPALNTTYTVTVTDVNGCTASTTTTVTVNPLPTSSNTTLTECATSPGMASFTLTDAGTFPGGSNTISDIDNGQSGLTITYHASLANAMSGVGPLSSPYSSGSTNVFARLETPSTGCYTTAVVTLLVNAIPTGVAIQNTNNGNATADFNVCQGSNINLGVAGTGTAPLSYAWTLPNGSTTTGSPLNIGTANLATHNGLWVVTVTDANGCTATDNINITVNPLPTSSTTTLRECATSSNMASFTLTDAEGTSGSNIGLDIDNGQTGLTITYYISMANAVSGTGALSSPYPSGNTTIYTRLQNSTTGCFTTNTITLTVAPLPTSSNTTLRQCATSPGMASFTLTDAETFPGGSNTIADIDNGQSGLTITYHASLADAMSDTGSLSSPYSSGNTDVYARLENVTTGCYTTATVTLVVSPLPTGVAIQNTNNGNATANFTVCQGSNINLGVAGTGTGILSYTWTIPNGSTLSGSPLNIVSATPATHSGLWVVTVTDANGCTATDDINITVDPAPTNDACGGATALTGSSTNGNNLCATQDITACGTNGVASVWYSYTVPADIKTVTFTLSGLTAGVMSVYDGCGGATVGNATCSSTVIMDCPVSGSVLYLFVSSMVANQGNFTIATTEVNISAANDLCTAAVAIPSAPLCEFFAVTGSTSVGACPEGITVGGCGLNYATDAIVWYEFTAPAGTTTTEIRNIDGTLTVFTNCPGTTIAPGGSCLSGAASQTITTTAGTTYYIGIGVPGGSGPVGFDIKYNVGPSNDLCANAVGIGSAGSASSTNSCAGSDLTGACAGAVYEASVWFSVTVDVGSTGLDVTITGGGGTPMMGSGAATLVQSGCTTVSPGEVCFTVGTMFDFECIPPGTYDLQIATSSANAGDFTIDVQQARSGVSGPDNDPCEMAAAINMNGICVPIPVSGNNTNACPELFSIGGCNFGTDPTTWHTFTVDANASSIDIMSITGGAYLGIFTGSPCATNAPSQLPGGGCITSNTTTISVTGGTTYYIAVGHLTGTAYTFNIIQNVTPPNDTPCTAQTIGTATQTNTCCAGNNIGSNCSNGAQASVWFVYPATAGVIGLTISYTNSSITGSNVFEIFQGTDCSGIAPMDRTIFDPSCAGNVTTTIRCQDFDTQNTYFRVGSTVAGCGNFGLSVTPLLQTCNSAVDCAAAPTVSVNVDGQACIPGCNLSICGDGACDPLGNATYYAFTFDPTTVSAAVIQVTGASFTPIISLAYDCFGPFVNCFNGGTTEPVPIGGGTIYVRVEGAGGINLDDNFSVCANAFGGGNFDCYSATFIPTRPEYPNADPKGPYCSGEVVNFCYNVNFIVSPGGTVPPNGNNCQWIQGIVPVIYDGWDLVALPVSGQGPGGANWLPSGDVHYNFNSPQYAPITLPNGELGLEWGPGGLTSGGDMPAGWYWASQGSGPLCTNASNPDDAWGLPGGCGSTQTVNFCFNLKVREFTTVDECQAASLKITMFSFADGELGCWTNLSCALSTPFVWNGQPACNSIVIIEGDDLEVCTGNTVNVIATSNNSTATLVLTTTDNPNVTGETLSGSFPFGNMSIFDNLVNNTNSIQIVEYNLYATLPGQPCISPPKKILVTVYPELEGTFSPDPAFVCNPGDCLNLTINPTGGSGTYVSFIWTGPGYSGSGQTVSVCPTAPSSYTVVFMDNKGCIGMEEVQVDIKDPVTVTVDPLSVSLCKDGVVGNSDPIYGNVISGTFPFLYTWTPPGGIQGFGSPFFTTGDDRYDILEETSQQTSGYLVLTVTDNWGCTGTAETFVSVDQGPNPAFTYLPLQCGNRRVDDVATFNIGGSSSGLDRFELYDCSENLIAIGYNNTTIFQQVDMDVWGNCFTLLTYTGSGCVVERSLTVPLTSGTQVLLNGDTDRCINGSDAVISVNNSTAFTSYIWSNMQTTRSISVSPATTSTYTVTATDANGCTSTANRAIRVNQAPVVSFSGSTSICIGEMTTLTAISTIPGTIFTWTNTTTGVITSGATITLSTGAELILTALSPAGCESVPRSISVVVGSTLTPQISELTICDGSTGTLDVGVGFATYLWSNGATTQTISVMAGGTFTVSVTQGICSGTDEVTVVNNLSPILSLPASPVSVCRTNDGFGASTVDFNAQLSPLGVTGVWREITSSAVDISNLNSVSFFGVPVGTYRFEFTTDNAMSPCTDKVDTLSIQVNPCICPQILPIGPLCNAGSTRVDLNTRKGNPTLGGTFSIISPAGVTITNNQFNPIGLAPGTYTLQWEITPTCKPTIEIIVFGAPNASLTATTGIVCNDSTTGTTTFDLNTLKTAITSAGRWTLVSGPAGSFTAPSTLNGLGLAKDDKITLEYTTTTAQSPCVDIKTTVVFTVVDCKCTQVRITGFNLCNGSNTPLDLNSVQVLTTTPAGMLGSWTSSAPGAVTGTNIFNPFGVASGPYTITFTLKDPVAGCTATFTEPIQITRQPRAEANLPGTACNVSTGNGSTSIILNSMLKSGFTTQGTWTQTSGTPTLPIVAGAVDFTGQTIGSVYRFRYSVTATAPCTPVSADVEVTVRSCDCPIINLGIPSPLCNLSGVLDLGTLEIAGNAPGVWTVTSPTNNAVPTPGKLLDAKGLEAGVYKLKYALVPAPAGACRKDTTITVRIELQNTAVTRDTVVCNTASPQGTTILDLRTLIESINGTGKWVDETGKDIADITRVNFTGRTIGDKVYQFQMTSVSPCQNTNIPTTISVIDCSCEQIVLGTIPSVCTSANTLDLKAFSDLKSGTWTAVNPLLIITNGVLDLRSVPAGIYTLTYRLTTAAPGCPVTKTATVSVFRPKSAGNARGAEFCAGATDVVSLFDRLDGEETGGTWTVVIGGVTGFNAANGTFNLGGRPVGSYTFKYSFAGQAPCPNDDEDVVIKINAIPVADAGADKNLDCTIQTATLGGTNTSVGNNLVYEWRSNNIVVGNRNTLSVNNGGDFILTVRDTVTKCSSSDAVTVVKADDLPVFNIKVDTIACFGQVGTITLSNLTGGASPYQISFNGGTTYGNALVANNLKTGSYKVLVKDANGCVNDQTPVVNILEPPLFSINLGNDFFLKIGEDSLLSLVNVPGINRVISIEWKINGVVNTAAQNQTSLLAKPEDDTNYAVTVVNKSGCIASDIIKVLIKKVTPECVPNIFAPNGQGNNNYFSINCLDVESVTTYRVYDRWGNLMFSGENLKPTDPQSFWDGRFKGKDAVPGVYAYVIELKFSNGETEVRKGDVTLVR